MANRRIAAAGGVWRKYLMAFSGENQPSGLVAGGWLAHASNGK